MMLSFFVMSKFCVRKAEKAGLFDVVHVHVPSMLKGDVVTAHSVHASGVAIAQQHMSAWQKLYYKIRTLEPLILFMARFNFVANRARKVIAISEVVKRELIDFLGVPPGKIEVIYNGVNIERFQASNMVRAEVRTTLGFSDDECVILFVANEFKRKGLDYLMRAIARLPKDVGKYRLLIVGDSNDGALSRQDCIDLAVEQGVDDLLFFAGKVREVERYFACSDMFVLPTQYEPFGLVITEAMAAGLPVLVSKSAGAAELIQHGVSGLLLYDPRDVEEMTDKITLLLQNSQLRNELGAVAKTTVKSCSWAAIAEYTVKLYRDTVPYC